MRTLPRKALGIIEFRREKQMVGIWASINQILQCMAGKEESKAYLEATLEEREGHFIWETLSKGKKESITRLLDEVDIRTIPNKIVVKNSTQKIPGTQSRMMQERRYSQEHEYT